MNRLRTGRILFYAVLFAGLIITDSVTGAAVKTNSGPAALPQLFKKGGPKAAVKAKKKQEAKKKKEKKDYADYVKANQKRSIEIQTPEVQERMKQNVKDANTKYKSKKKTNASRTKKAGRKYKS